MRWIVANMKWILLVAGALTCTMVYAAVAPQAALRSTFGETLEGPVADIVVRSWGALIALVGAMLIHAALNPPSRAVALTVAAVSKLFFVGLVLSLGSQYLGQQAGIAVAADTVMVVLFVSYLVAERRGGRAA